MNLLANLLNVLLEIRLKGLYEKKTFEVRIRFELDFLYSTMP